MFDLSSEITSSFEESGTFYVMFHGVYLFTAVYSPKEDILLRHLSIPTQGI